MVSVTMHD